MRKPRRHTDARVADYWLTHDSVGEIDWSRPGVRLEFDPDVERPTRPVTLRLSRRLLQELRVLAKDRDVPYQYSVPRGLAGPGVDRGGRAGLS